MAECCVPFFGHCGLVDLDLVDLDLVSRIIESGAYLLNYLRQEFQIWCVDDLRMAECRVSILGHCILGF